MSQEGLDARCLSDPLNEAQRAVLRGQKRTETLYGGLLALGEINPNFQARQLFFSESDTDWHLQNPENLPAPTLAE